MSSLPHTTVRRRTFLTGVALTAAAGCGEEAPEEDPSPSETASATPTEAPAAPDFSAAETVATGLAVPWGLVFPPDEDALVGERDSGRVLRVPLGGGEPEEVYRIEDIDPDGEGGLLGLAVSPSYAEDGYVYAYFTAGDGNRVVRFRLDGEIEPVFDGIAAADHHDGGRIAFGPDGLLYAATGDAGEPDRAQDPESPNGKILRLTPEGDPTPDNPTPDSPVYSLGHRNVEGFAWDGEGRLFASEFGSDQADEVNRIEPGGNYGWPEVEGEGDIGGGEYTNPLVTWSPSEASPAGVAVAGDTLYVAALRGERLWAVPLTGDGGLGEPEALLEGEYGRLRTVATAPDGSLWLTTSNEDGYGDPREGGDRIIRFPAG
ncbi:PQQ-dependent sugar dehydrogenase [Glycomyces sp. TRM65418]|uniref:PQQ-dependent sugar dehydrogenase n=1 Tax=Glycomyces sp. TRM65418 TaxID=2867006 RepID=UPI001CE6C832|nr:PQQ-dependent sugar dehydrogenase [Glycomyces sp. TRM65418]MCC3763295.1 PQQ-dependent sugar dehydrogenase [Glycomyces sp. TRM65418]QZD57294.1 PQQ-dependent sugar dehydrogenase [Glycomyces sp. TRM65418]